MKKKQKCKDRKNYLLLAIASLVVVGLFTTAVYAATYETENNDTIQTADVISLGAATTGNMKSGSDKDWYTFTTPNDGKVSVSFSHQTATSGNGWDIYLYKYNPTTLETTEIKSFGSSRSEPYKITQNIGLPAGTYYIKVIPSYNLNNLSIDYFVTANFSASATWEKEFNDELNTANQIPLGVAYAGSILSAYKDDWFKFTIPESGKVRVNFKHQIEESGHGWDVSLYQYNPNTYKTTEITSFSSNREDAYIDTPSIGLPAGTYYIQVEAGAEFSYLSTDYFVTAYFSPSTTWEKEFNNQLPTANLISKNVSYKGSLIDSDDDDWYKFTTTATSLVWLNFQHQIAENGNGWDISLYKYNPNTFETTEMSSVSSYRDDAVVNTSKVSLAAGTYYIHVEPSSTYNTLLMDYSVTAMVPPTAPQAPSAVSNTYNSIKVSWSPVAGATGYTVYRYSSSTGGYVKMMSVTGTSYTNTALITGKSYSYKVYAYKTVAGTNIFSPSSKVVSAKPIPSAPTLTLSKYTSTAIKVSWTAVSGASGYQIYRATSANGPYYWTDTVSWTTRSWVNTSRTVGKTYYYKVRAYHVENGARVYGKFSIAHYVKL